MSIAFPVENNYKYNGMGILINNYFNEMCKEHGPAKGKAKEEGKERVCRWKRQEKLEEVRELRKLAG